MRKQFVIGSRIWERDKKNAEYYVGDYLFKLHYSNSGVAKPLPGGKKVPAKTFSSALWNFLIIKLVTKVLKILQQLIENSTIKGAEITFDMFWSIIVL